VKILALTRYDPAGASSRYRVYQYLPYLRAAGIEIDEAPLVDHRYIQRLYGGRGRSAAGLVGAAMRRVTRVLTARRYDLVWMEKELLPFAPNWLERYLRLRGVPLVVDYDDAIFHKYDLHRARLVRQVLGTKIDGVMAAATLVIAGNPYLAARATAAGAPSVEILPTVIDLDRYPLAPRADRARLTLGWIGSPSTQDYLRHIAPALARFCAEHDACVHAIGVRPDFALEGVPLVRVPWTDAGEVAALQQLDVGMMPLPDSPWERGKCGFKLIQYMGCALPVIASPVGVNREIVLDGETGYLARSQEEWLAAFRRLAGAVELRGQMGAAGRARVEAHYSLQIAAPQLLTLLCSAAGLAAPGDRGGAG
jgi:glycosyltransferase involved in cell wall biosynthesis